NRGDDLKIISPEITRTKRGSATALSESPRNAEVLWVGSDDGYVWVTKDGGKEWTNVTKNIGLPGDRWVATIEASRFVEGRAYVCFDAHRSNDDKPYVYVTQDFGATWKPIMANLPAFGSTRCLREDVVNPDLLYCGTEFAIFASIDRGLSWTKINNNLPTVAIHEVAVHPTAGEIVVATHGRSLWVLDVSGLRQMKKETIQADAHLYQPHTVIRYRSEPARGGTTRRFVGESAPVGAQIYFNLNKKAEQVSLKVVDAKGEVVTELQRVPKEAGLHKVSWTLNRTGPSMLGGFMDSLGSVGSSAGRRGQGGRTSGAGSSASTGGGTGAQASGASGESGTAQAGGAQAGSGRRGGQPQTTTGTGTAGTSTASQTSGTPVQGGGGPVGMGMERPGFGGRVVPPGTYGIVLTVDGKEYRQTVQVIGDPNVPESFRLTPEEEMELELDQTEYKRKLEK
ncbi:MAG TPA: hypothetical protein PKA06_11660, partial [Gemmatales bacterium]|nr:hypothetical protein [Gemmatales bacterium]